MNGYYIMQGAFQGLGYDWVQAQQALYDEFVESGLENEALMNGTTVSLGFINNQTDMDWVFMNKFVLSTIQEGLF